MENGQSKKKRIYVLLVLISLTFFIPLISAWTTGDCLGTGGSVSIDGDYCVNVFSGNGTFAVSGAIANATYLIIAGGGGGGHDNSGGGGGGGLIYGSSSISSGNYPIVIGSGGIGGDTSTKIGTNGANTTFNGLTAIGGGAGGSLHSTIPCTNGGSGGGAGMQPQYANMYCNGTTGQGYSGGIGVGAGSGQYYGSGGGGAGRNGTMADPGNASGGVGLSYSITGTNVCYAGGGGGGGNDHYHEVANFGYCGGGTGGWWGFTGDTSTGYGTPGTDGLGGGGGGGGGSDNGEAGGKGGSGVVIVRYFAGAGVVASPLNVNMTYPMNKSYGINVSAINYTTNGTACWYSTNLGVTNSTSVLGGINFTSVTSTEGSNTWKVYCNDSFNNVNVSTITFTKDTTPPTIAFMSQFPQNITSFNIYTSKLNVTYNITDVSGVNTVFYISKTNESSTEIWQYINGTQTVKGYNTLINGTNVRVGVVLSNILSVWNFMVSSNLIYPSDFNINPEVTGLEAKSMITLDSSSQFYKIRFFNMSINSYGTFNFMANSTTDADDLLIYYCNSSFESVNIDTSMCGLIANFPATTTFNYSLSPYSTYNFVPFTINVTTGTISGIKVTPVGYFGFQGVNTGSWDVYYLPNISRPDTIQYSDDGGGNFDNFSGTINAFVSQYTPLNYTNYYYVCANDNWGNFGCSDVRSNKIVETLQAPTIPFVYSPTSKTYNKNISINYTSSESPTIMLFYNISLMSNGIYNKTIKSNNSLNLGYIWNTIGTTDGNYTIRVEAVDNGTGILSLSSYGYSNEFTIDNTAPALSITYPVTNKYYPAMTQLNYTINNVLGSCWYSLNNGVTNTTITCGNNITGLTSSEGANAWYLWANDSIGNLNNTFVTFTKDTISPTISFGDGTLATNVNVSQNNIYINTTWTEVNFANITFNLWNSTNLYNTQNFTTPTTFAYNFTSIPNGYYYYNVTICDKVGRCASTPENRNILLDTVSPTAQQGYTGGTGGGSSYFAGTNNSHFNNVPVNVTGNVTDIYGIKNITINITNSSGATINKTTITFFGNVFKYLFGIPLYLIDGVYNFVVDAYDIASNYITTGIMTFTVDSSYPIFSDNAQNIISGSEYNPSNVYEFNITINNTNMTTGIEFNGINYTMSNISNVFSRSFLNLSVGSYPYYYWAYGNGILTNFDKTSIYYYTVSQSNLTNTQFFNVPTYPYVDLNVSYPIEYKVLINNVSANVGVISMNITNPDTNSTVFNFTWDVSSQSYKMNLLFTEEGNYPFEIYAYPPYHFSFTGEFLARQSFNLTLCGYQQKDMTPYKNDFAYLTAELTNSQNYYNANLEQFLTPFQLGILGFPSTFKIPVFHAFYINGCGTIKLYEKNQEYAIRLMDGIINYDTTFSPPNVTKSYGTDIYIGKFILNGTNENLSVLLTEKDISQYKWLANWIFIILVCVAFIGSIFLFFVIPEKPSLSIIFGGGFISMLTLIRIIVWFKFGW